MKTIRLLSLSLLLLLGGCVVPAENAVTSRKMTVLGINISPWAQGPQIQIGLVRWHNWSVPVSTNDLHAPPFSADVKADIGALHQTADEQFRVSQPTNP